MGAKLCGEWEVRKKCLKSEIEKVSVFFHFEKLLKISLWERDGIKPTLLSTKKRILNWAKWCNMGRNKLHHTKDWDGMGEGIVWVSGMEIKIAENFNGAREKGLFVLIIAISLLPMCENVWPSDSTCMCILISISFDGMSALVLAAEELYKNDECLIGCMGE